MAFSFDNATNTFKFDWKEGRWNYHRSKVTYIPAERNLVAAIPNWFQVKFNDDNIRSFIDDWETVRQATTNNLPVLNLNVSYHYDSNTKSDKVQVADDITLDFTNTSSGLQSLIPLYVHLSHLVYRDDTKISIGNSRENEKLQELIYRELPADEREAIYNNFTKAESCDVFLEEPEANLFPPTQTVLVEWLLELTKEQKPCNLFIATHSPYILETFHV